MNETGKVYLVGAGPGDPGLITEKGLRLLRECDTVVYDHLANDCLLDYVKSGCQKIYVGKQAGHHSMKQEEINQVLVEEAKKGRVIVRLKGGDPFVFGRGGEEVLTLFGEGIPYEVVPGVTSAVAALSSAGIPITHRALSRSFHVMTGHTLSEDGSLPEDFDTFAKLSGTLVFLMGLGNLSLIVKGLLRNEKAPSTPAAVIEGGTLPGQKVVRATLENIVEAAEAAEICSPAIIVVGEVAALNMESTVDRPLKGRKIGVTGTPSFTEKLLNLLDKQGGDAKKICGLGVKTYEDSPQISAALAELSSYTWLVFTSANSIRLFLEALIKSGGDYRALGHIKLAVVGKGTARELWQYGFCADYVPEEFCVSALAAGMEKFLTDKDRLLIPRSSGGSKELNEMLDRKGITYSDVILYDVVGEKPEKDCLLEDLRSLDYLTFASASGVEAFYDDLANEAVEALEKLRVVCIGDMTAKSLENHGRKPDLIARPFSIPGMAQAIRRDVMERYPQKMEHSREDGEVWHEHQTITGTI